MNSWIGLWTILLVSSLAVFAALAVVVSFRGFFDVRSMLRQIKSEHDKRRN